MTIGLKLFRNHFIVVCVHMDNLVVVFIGILYDFFILTYLLNVLIQFKANRQPTAEHVNQLMTTNTFRVLQKLIVTAEMNILNTEWMGEQIQWFDYYIIANFLM